MQPILMIVLATATGVPLGLWLRRNLATLGYRTAEEADRPAPGPRWWVVWASVLALGSLAAAASLSRYPLAYLPLLPLCIAGPWLAAVDLDVLRIPNRVLGPIAAAILIMIVGTAAGVQRWATVVDSPTAALLTGSLFAAVHFATSGGIGFGDVKLVTTISLGIGPLGLGTVWLGATIGSVGAIVWTNATSKTGHIPYGAWLLGGCWLSVFTASLGR